MFNEETFYTPQELQAMWEEEKRLLTKLLESKKEIAGRLIQGSSVLLPLLKISPQVRGISTLASIGNGLIKQASQKMTPYVGRKIAELSTKGTVLGGLTGGVEGLGRGMAEDKNPLKTTIQDAVIGGVSGFVGGNSVGNLQKIIKGKNLKKYANIDELDPITRKDYNNASRKYYQDYIQGTNLYKDGKINLSKRGVQEQLRWNPQWAQNFPELKKDIKNAQRMPDLLNKDSSKKFTDHFEVYKGKLGEHLVEVNKDGTRRYYITKSTPDSTPLATSKGSAKDATTIIPPFLNSLNPTSHKTKSGRKPNPYPLGSEEYWQEEARRARFW